MANAGPDIQALIQAAVTAALQAQNVQNENANERVLKRLRQPKALTLFTLQYGKWDDWYIQLKAQLIALECLPALSPDQADGTFQLTPEIQQLLKAKLAQYLRGNDVHKIMDDTKSLYTALQEIKSERSGAEKIVILDHNNALMDLHRKPAEGIVALCSRASDHYRILLDQSGDTTMQTFVMCIMLLEFG